MPGPLLPLRGFPPLGLVPPTLLLGGGGMYKRRPSSSRFLALCEGRNICSSLLHYSTWGRHNSARSLLTPMPVCGSWKREVVSEWLPRSLLLDAVALQDNKTRYELSAPAVLMRDHSTTSAVLVFAGYQKKPKKRENRENIFCSAAKVIFRRSR